MDNVNVLAEHLWRSNKHGDVYLKGCADVPEIAAGTLEYFVYYSAERTPITGLRHTRRGLPDSERRRSEERGARINSMRGTLI
ncbi:MAG: hypothetical protein ACREUM_01330 [Nitrosospira sp.]